VKIALDLKTVTSLIDGDPPHLRECMDDALAEGHELVMSSLVLHDLAHAALAGEHAARKLAQLDAFIAQVEVAPWTSEDALTAARLRADHEKVSGRAWQMDLPQILCAAQALNHDWIIIVQTPPMTPPLPQSMRALMSRLGGPLAALRTIDWSAPAG
jgi:predicted nucleic acid-binding protein